MSKPSVNNKPTIASLRLRHDKANEFVANLIVQNPERYIEAQIQWAKAFLERKTLAASQGFK